MNIKECFCIIKIFHKDYNNSNNNKILKANYVMNITKEFHIRCLSGCQNYVNLLQDIVFYAQNFKRDAIF